MIPQPTRFVGANVVNEGQVNISDVLIASDGTIAAVGNACNTHEELLRPLKLMPLVSG